MRAIRFSAVVLFTGLGLACKTSGDLEPVVIDFTARNTPTATPRAEVSPTPTPGMMRSEPPSPSPTAAPTPPVSSARASPRAGSAPAGPASYEEAWNRHDAGALAALFTADAQIYDPPDRLRESGVSAIRRSFERRFASAPDAVLRVSERWTQGAFVVERQTESAPGGAETSAVVISEIRDGRIARIWVLR